MRLAIASIIAFFAALSPALAAAPQAEAKPQYRPERLKYYQALRNSRLAGWDAQGDGLYVITGFDDGPQVFWRAKPEAPLEQVTHLVGAVIDATPSPTDPNVVVVLSDDNGDERRRITLHDRSDGRVNTLANDAIEARAIHWSPDGERVAWIAVTDSNTRSIFAASNLKRADNRIDIIALDNADWRLLAWSPDGGRLLLKKVRSAAHSQLYEIVLESGALDELDVDADPGAYGAAAYDLDGDYIYFASNRQSEYMQLVRYDREKRRRKIISGKLNADVIRIAPGSDGFSVAYTTRTLLSDTLFFRDARGRTKPVLNTLPARITALQFAPGKSEVGLSVSVAAAPEEVYSFKIVPSDAPLVRWTFAKVAVIDPNAFLNPLPITFRSADDDRRMITGLAYHRPNEGRSPVIVSFHGGPESTAGPAFDHEIQFWATELGATVILPNIRGSTGAGKTFEALDNGMNRARSLNDIAGLLNWIAAQRDLDPTRIVVHGSSYGGYLAMISLVQFGDRLSGGISLHGISDIGTFLEETADYRRARRREEYGDERHPDMRASMDAISPLRMAEQINDPVLLVHGVHDPRVPVSQADKFAGALKRAGVETVYIRSEADGHWLVDTRNRVEVETETARFLAGLFRLSPSQ